MAKGMKVGKHNHVQTIKYSGVVKVQGSMGARQ